MAIVGFDKDGFALTDGEAVAYVADYDRVYQGQYTVMVSAAAGLPGGAYHDAPPKAEKGKAVMRSADGKSWELVDDYRGKTVYATDKSRSDIVLLPGEIAFGYTLLSPLTAFDEWDGEKWVTDKVAQQQAAVSDAESEKVELLGAATDKIRVWQTKLMMGRKLSDNDTAALNTWMDYIDALDAVDTSAASAEASIDFPALPVI